jgi:hypothetical protein
MPPPETTLTNGHTAPMRGRARRPTVCPGGAQATHGLACSCHMCGGAAAEAPPKGMELTAYSIRSVLAPASGRSSCLAFGFFPD